MPTGIVTVDLREDAIPLKELWPLGLWWLLNPTNRPTGVSRA
jgi:hypothetical protein